MAVAALYTQVPKGGPAGGKVAGANADCTWRPGHTCAPGALAARKRRRGPGDRQHSGWEDQVRRAAFPDPSFPVPRDRDPCPPRLSAPPPEPQVESELPTGT